VTEILVRNRFEEAAPIDLTQVDRYRSDALAAVGARSPVLRMSRGRG
jgi:hypothetical protein